ncbi:unnamed protein product, partial [Didymodactylos carnosus]
LLPANYGANSKLIGTHILFRTGDRTPLSTYPADPLQETFWPNGFNQLTMTGVQQSINLGTYVRGRYDDLLNKTYVAHEVSDNRKLYITAIAPKSHPTLLRLKKNCRLFRRGGTGKSGF